jgi:hypothetical protein
LSWPRCRRHTSRKNFNLGYIFWTRGEDSDNSHIHLDISWGNFSFGKKTFDLVTSCLDFDLVLKNCNLDYIFWTRGEMILKIHVEISHEEISLVVPIILI